MVLDENPTLLPATTKKNQNQNVLLAETSRNVKYTIDQQGHLPYY